MGGNQTSESPLSIVGSSRKVHHDNFPLSSVQIGSVDKLGNKIKEILWISSDYAIYLTGRGVFIHFSDRKDKEIEQRIAFTVICPELCELRYLISEMHGTHLHPFFLVKKYFKQTRSDDQGHSLFDHNIAQSLMLLMEGKQDDAKSIATAALNMAINRSTNDNTIRYIRASIFAALILFLTLCVLYVISRFFSEIQISEVSPFFVASFYGILGASFSIITRVQSFEMKPCQQSNMNYWMACIRIMLGLIGGLSFFLFAQSPLGRAFVNQDIVSGWKGAALIGFLGGFAERLVQTVFRRTASGMEGKTGTPVQHARTPVVVGDAPSRQIGGAIA